jgi:hypothetical protein
LNAVESFRASLAAQATAFAPILWEHLPELVHQSGVEWWRDPNAARRLFADAAAIANADAMFVFAAQAALLDASAEKRVGDHAIDTLAQRPMVAAGAELIALLRAVHSFGVIAAVPAPSVLLRALDGHEPEAAEDAFADLIVSALDAGADAVAVTTTDTGELSDAVTRASRLAELFQAPVLGLRLDPTGAGGFVRGGPELVVLSSDGAWPSEARGLVITPGDVSGRWDAEQLRAAGSHR